MLTATLNSVCAELRNYFTKDEDRKIGSYVIADGKFSPLIDFPTHYVRIVGSRLNDGVYDINDMVLEDEEFTGAIWYMSVPKDFIELVNDIELWQDKYCGVDSNLMSPYQSESFGGYSYSKGSGGNSESSATVPTWQGTFANRLKQYRRIRTL